MRTPCDDCGLLVEHSTIGFGMSSEQWRKRVSEHMDGILLDIPDYLHLGIKHLVAISAGSGSSVLAEMQIPEETKGTVCENE